MESNLIKPYERECLGILFSLITPLCKKLRKFFNLIFFGNLSRTFHNSYLPLFRRWGRRTAFCIFAAFAGALGIVKSFSHNYQLYLAMEFFEAALGYGFNSAAYVMSTLCWTLLTCH